MTIDLLILAFTLGLGTAQPIGPSPETSQNVIIRGIGGECYRNGIWYNPCPPPNPEPPPNPTPEIRQE